MSRASNRGRNGSGPKQKKRSNTYDQLRERFGGKIPPKRGTEEHSTEQFLRDIASGVCPQIKIIVEDKL